MKVKKQAPWMMWGVVLVFSFTMMFLNQGPKDLAKNKDD